MPSAWVAATMAAIAVALWVAPAPRSRLRELQARAASAFDPLRACTRFAQRLPFGPPARRRRQDERIATIEALAALAAELRSGAPGSVALVRTGAGQWPRAIITITQGGSPREVAQALLDDAEGRPALRPLAAAWSLTVSTGMAVAPLVEGIVDVVRAQEGVRGELQAQLAGPRATGRMLAALPIFAIIIGFVLGADPLTWLLTTAQGLLCLIGGLGLTTAGLLWIGALGRRVERHLP